MDENSARTETRTYQYCAVQLNAFSLMLVTALSGLCGGISWALLLFAANSLGVVELERFDNPLANIIIFPIFGAFGSALFAVIGFPLYKWVCKNLRGQRLSGIFHNPHD